MRLIEGGRTFSGGVQGWCSGEKGEFCGGPIKLEFVEPESLHRYLPAARSAEAASSLSALCKDENWRIAHLSAMRPT